MPALPPVAALMTATWRWPVGIPIPVSESPLFFVYPQITQIIGNYAAGYESWGIKKKDGMDWNDWGAVNVYRETAGWVGSGGWFFGLSIDYTDYRRLCTQLKAGERIKKQGGETEWVGESVGGDKVKGKGKKRIMGDSLTAMPLEGRFWDGFSGETYNLMGPNPSCPGPLRPPTREYVRVEKNYSLQKETIDL